MVSWERGECPKEVREEGNIRLGVVCVRKRWKICVCFLGEKLRI